jgi:hypothetical protein
MITVGTTVVSGSPINGGGGAGLPVAAGAGEVPVSTGAGTTYAASPISTEVSTVIAGFLGAVSGRTVIGDGAGSLLTTSADVSGFLAAADADAARAALGLASVPTAPVALGTAYNSGTADAIYVDAVPSPADAWGPGRSLVYLFRSLGTLGSANILAMHADTSTTVARGWHLRAGDNASARGEISLIFAGIPGSTVLPLPGADFTGADGVHCLAMAVTALGVVRYSWDGGTVATVAAGAGTYAPAQAADPWRIGSSAVSGGGFAATTVQPLALRTYSTVLSDDDLVAVCALRASYLLADPAAGTLTTDLSASQFRGAATAIDRASSQRWRLVGALLVHEQP